MTTIAYRFQVAGHTAADWTAGNPVLLDREYAVERDTGKVKLGDGTTAWNSLPYFGSTTLADGSVTNAKLANMAQATFKGRAAGAGTGAPADLTATQAKAILALTASDVSGLATVATSGDAGDLTGTLSNARLSAFTGDATKAAGSGVLTLATVNSNTGTYGGAATVPQISVDGKGRITGVTAVSISLGWSAITGTPTTLAGYGITLTSGNVTTALGFTPENSANKGAANGYASLGSDGKVPSSQLPAASGPGASVSWPTTVTLTATSGTITSYTVNTAAYYQFGKWVFFRFVITINNAGTAAGAYALNLPVNAISLYMSFSGFEGGVTGKALLGWNETVSQLRLRNPDGTLPTAAGTMLCMSGMYECA
jgi:hypothetical protein